MPDQRHRGGRGGRLVQRWRNSGAQGKIEGLQSHDHFGLPMDGKSYLHWHLCEKCGSQFSHRHKRRTLTDSLRLEPRHICYGCRKLPAIPPVEVGKRARAATDEFRADTISTCSTGSSWWEGGQFIVSHSRPSDCRKKGVAAQTEMTIADCTNRRIGHAVQFAGVPLALPKPEDDDVFEDALDHVYVNQPPPVPVDQGTDPEPVAVVQQEQEVEDHFDDLVSYLRIQIFLMKRTPDTMRGLVRKGDFWLQDHGVTSARDRYDILPRAATAAFKSSSGERHWIREIGSESGHADVIRVDQAARGVLDVTGLDRGWRRWGRMLLRIATLGYYTGTIERRLNTT